MVHDGDLLPFSDLGSLGSCTRSTNSLAPVNGAGSANNPTLMSRANINDRETKPARWFEPDLTGATFGQWTVLGPDNRHNRKSYWLCRCECGNEKAVSGWALRKRRSTRCRSCASPFRRFIDLTGQTFGHLQVVAIAGRDRFGRVRWRCKCLRCGRTPVVSADHLRRGHTRTCGCYRRELLRMRTRAANAALKVVRSTPGLLQ